MPRPPRDGAAGLHHVIVGAAAKNRYYVDEIDRLDWMRRFVRTLDVHEWTCLSVCQLDTHVHTILDVPASSLSRGMHYLNSVYSREFNQRHERRGYLVRSRFWSKRILDDPQLLGTYAYVAKNPVRAGRCRKAESWRWSSFADALGAASAFPFVDASRVLALLGGDPALLRHFVAAWRGDDMSP